MTSIPESLAAEVAKRAGYRCEYCLLPTTGQVAPFEVDHVLPRVDGGATVLESLSYACPHCNAHKWRFTQAFDGETQTTVTLFNPRSQLWSGHFQWSHDEPGIVMGKTPCGRATIDRLQMNHLAS